MVCDGYTYSYTGRAHPSMRNMRPMAPPKERLMRAAREAEDRGTPVLAQGIIHRKSLISWWLQGPWRFGATM